VEEVEKNFKYAKRTMIIGGGKACEILLSEIQEAQQAPSGDRYAAQFDPVCIIDDDDSKLYTDVKGVKVIGKIPDIPQIARKYHIEQIILAIPSISEDGRKLVIDLCNETKLPLKIIPYIGTLILSKNSTILNQIRDIKTEELLGRDPVTFNNENIRVKRQTTKTTNRGTTLVVRM
jgi:FlaA1/EpsC-like NDP-sugar epimerase